MSNQPEIYSSSTLNDLFRSKLKQQIGFTIKDARDKDRAILTFSGGLTGKVDWSENSASIVRDAAERINLVQISTEFYPSSLSMELSNVGVKFDSQRDDDWPNWFRKITSGACLLPDTNILLKRTLTSVIFPRFISLRTRQLALPCKVSIPRLSILELEDLANSSQEGRERASKGECFMAFNEVRVLTSKYGATLTPPLSAEEIRSFAEIKKLKFVDPLIREEIRRFGKTSGNRVVFLTRDMVSALAANSEDLDAVYMSPKYPEQHSLNDVDIAKLTELVIEIATAISKIRLDWDDGESLQIEGIWSGKNWYDYYRRRVQITSLP